MEVRLHESVDEFRTLAEPVYRRDPVAHTIELTVLQSTALPDDSLLLTVWDDKHVVGAAMQTPPYPLTCNGIRIEHVGVVAAYLADTRPELSGVRGGRETAIAFADAWHAVTGHAATVTLEERLYRLGALRPPAAVAGNHHEATDAGRGVLVRWVELFLGEAFGLAGEDGVGERFVDAAKDKGDRFVLWVVDAEPVSMAMLRAPACGVSRIGPVFTPTDRRGEGYGSAITAAAAQLARDNGVDDVVLFTDLSNPVSNAIYQRIGFEAVADFLRIRFGTVG